MMLREWARFAARAAVDTASEILYWSPGLSSGISP